MGNGVEESQRAACVDRKGDSTAALLIRLKVGAMAAILVASIVGVSMPLLGRRCSALLRPGRGSFFVVKAFASGVLVATAFVHMLPDAFEAAARLPSDYPVAGLISMASALLTLLLDFSANAYYQHKSTIRRPAVHHSSLAPAARSSIPPAPASCAHQYGMPSQSKPVELPIASHHSPTTMDDDATVVMSMRIRIRHRIISQVLEIGIVTHSVIIGISIGTLENPCALRPLLAAITFHQFFEGIGLGGCVAQGGFNTLGKFLMAAFFSMTTPLGIAIGIGIASTYDENSITALVVEGIFNAISAGILVYMSLVDLIATDFLSKQLQSNIKLQIYSFSALFFGAASMSVIGYWA